MTTQRFTTPGALLIKHALPTKEAQDRFNLYKPLDKGGVSELVTMLLKHGGDGAAEHINDLGKLFFNKATEIGATTPLSDYINNSDERNALIKEFDYKAHQILSSKDSREKKERDMISTVTDYENRIQKQNLSYLMSKGSTAARMASSGARGNPKQLSAGTATPLMASDLEGNLVPVVIKHSFAEGMTPAEQTALSYMGRGNTVLTQLSTSKPGALFKRLGPTLFHEVVTEEDCGTTNGILISIDDKKSLIGRFEAGSNRLIDEAYYKDLKHSNSKTVKARSIQTCEAREGVCKRCFGLMGNNKLPDIGENVGVIAAQSISEVLTQSMLGTKHKASVGERKGNAYDQASNILNNPRENFKDEATMSTIDGKVNDISKTPLGDFYVHVNNTPHFVSQQQSLISKIGDTVRRGQALSSGVLNPRKLVALTGIGTGRQYLSNELRNIYGGGLDPRHFEVVSKNLLKYTSVEDPGETDLLPGQTLTVNQVGDILSQDDVDTPIEHSVGKVLSRNTHEFTPGTVIDSNLADDLKSRGLTHAPTTRSRLRVTPIVPGLQTSKLLDSNWVSKLSFTRLMDTLKDSAATGAEADTHSIDPITPYVLGNEFGEGEGGRY